MQSGARLRGLCGFSGWHLHPASQTLGGLVQRVSADGEVGQALGGLHREGFAEVRHDLGVFAVPGELFGEGGGVEFGRNPERELADHVASLVESRKESPETRSRGEYAPAGVVASLPQPDIRRRGRVNTL